LADQTLSRKRWQKIGMSASDNFAYVSGTYLLLPEPVLKQASPQQRHIHTDFANTFKAIFTKIIADAPGFVKRYYT
jgi:hypothetical protein